MVLPSTAGDGNSIVRANRPGPRWSRPSGSAGTTSAIFTPGENVLPPSVDLKKNSENVAGTVPVQVGSLTAICSAVTYRVPLAVTIGVAPMYCSNEQLFGGGVNWSAYLRVQCLPPSVECATGRPLDEVWVKLLNEKSS